MSADVFMYTAKEILCVMVVWYGQQYTNHFINYNLLYNGAFVLKGKA